MSEYDPFAADYDTWSADMTEDVPSYVGLGRNAGEPIVELAVGSGFAHEPFTDDSLEFVWVARKSA